MASLLECCVLPAASEWGTLLSKASWWNAMTAGFRVDFNSNIPVTSWKSLLSLRFHCWKDKVETHSVWNSSYFILLCFLPRSLPSLFGLSSHIFYLAIFPIFLFIWVRIFFPFLRPSGFYSNLCRLIAEVSWRKLNHWPTFINLWQHTKTGLRSRMHYLIGLANLKVMVHLWTWGLNMEASCGVTN